MKNIAVVALSAIAGAAAFAPTLPTAALRANSNAMSSLQMGKQSYTRNFGYPCSTGASLVEKEAAKISQNKVDGWIYRPVGKWDKKAASTLKKGDKKGAIAEKFTDGAKLYVAQEDLKKAAKINIRRYHAQKST